MTRRQLLKCLAAAPPMLAFDLNGCGGGGPSPAPMQAVPWPEAEALFHQEPRWLGGDGVYSVDLGNGRVLWLFGDSFIATSAALTRSQSVMVRNSVAIQTGYDPATATMKFYWSGTPAKPGTFFVDPNPPKWFWPGHGAMVGNSLLIFFAQTQSSTGGLGFSGRGWQAALISNPGSTPDQWQIRYLNCPNVYSLVVGSSVLVQGSYLYLFSHSDANVGIYLARMPVSDAELGSFANLEWFDPTKGWILQSALTQAPSALMQNGQTEFNVYPSLPHSPWLEIQTDVFGAANIALRSSDALTGPWPGFQVFYGPPERSKPNVMIYAAKMHPMLTNSGADVVVSYSTNSTDFTTLVNDTTLYYPRFLKATWRRS